MADLARTQGKIAGAPDYDSPEFWDVRFATGQDVGEWLNPGNSLLEALLSDLERRSGIDERSPRVLHLGPGVSQLGIKLRDAFIERNWAGNGIAVSSLLSISILLGPSFQLTATLAECGLLRRGRSTWSRF